jgi:hypothetical protein
MPLPSALQYSRTIADTGEKTSLNISTAGAIIASGPRGTYAGQLTPEQSAELLNLLHAWDDIRLRPWFRRAWTVDTTDIVIRYGKRTVHACDLDGRNSAFWRLEHFLEQLFTALQAPNTPASS